MQQAVVTAPGQLDFREVADIQAIKPNEVLLSIRNIGICGSDIHVFHGAHPAVSYPVVQGHEFSAMVVRVGADVHDIKPGMKATARPQLVCGVCAPCIRGQYNVCQNLKVEGFQAPGAAQEFFVVPRDRVVILPDTMSYEHGAMVEPVAVAVHAVSKASTLIGENVVVSGAGPIGNLVAQVALMRGAKNVLITDVNNSRLAVATQCGISGTVNVRTDSFEAAVDEFFEGEGFQVAFEAAGVEESLATLLTFIEKGGEVVVVGVYAKNPVVNMYHLGEHELTLKGSLMYLHNDYLKAVELIDKKAIMLDPMISDRFSFLDFKVAYSHIEKERDKVMKIMISLST